MKSGAAKAAPWRTEWRSHNTTQRYGTVRYGTVRYGTVRYRQANNNFDTEHAT